MQATNEAIEKKIFGVPTFEVNGVLPGPETETLSMAFERQGPYLRRERFCLSCNDRQRPTVSGSTGRAPGRGPSCSISPLVLGVRHTTR